MTIRKKKINFTPCLQQTNLNLIFGNKLTEISDEQGKQNLCHKVYLSGQAFKQNQHIK